MPPKETLRVRLMIWRLRIRDRFGRLIPLWIVCLLFGLLLSWVVALGDWLLVESGQRIRPFLSRPSNDVSGVDLVEAGHRIVKHLPKHGFDADRYFVIGYGWPFPCWGTVFWERGSSSWQTAISPVVAIDVRPIWPAGDLPDPAYPHITRSSLLVASAPGTCPPPTLAYDRFQRYLPVFPLVGPSLLAAFLYGFPLYVWVKYRRRRFRRGVCHTCDYQLSGLAGRASHCPECGAGIASDSTGTASTA